MPRTKKLDNSEELLETKKTKKSESKEVKETKKATKSASKKTTKKETVKEAKKEEKKEKKTTKKTAEKPEKKETKKKAEEKETKKKVSRKKVDELVEDSFHYGDDDDDEIVETDFNEDEEETEDPDEINAEDLELASDLDLEGYEEFEASETGGDKKRVYKVSEHAEEVRKRFIGICAKYNSSDPEIKKEGINEAIEELKSFVHYVIKKKYSTYGKYYEDLVQEGIVGIIKGLEKYDPTKSLPTTFFNLYIIHEMSKYIDTEVNKTTSHYSSNLTKINRVIDKFEQQGRKWNPTDIAVETGLNMETVIQCLHIKDYKNEMYYETDENLESKISEHGDSPEQQFVKNERLAILYRSIGTLLPEEIQVLKYRYGLLGAQTISYKEIAKEMGVSIEKVRKYRHDAIKKLRHKSAMRSVFKDYINENDSNSLTEHDIAIIPEEIIDNTMKELAEIDIDFDFLNDEE